jgi:hypothetical protein
VRSANRATPPRKGAIRTSNPRSSHIGGRGWGGVAAVAGGGGGAGGGGARRRGRRRVGWQFTAGDGGGGAV